MTEVPARGPAPEAKEQPSSLRDDPDALLAQLMQGGAQVSDQGHGQDVDEYTEQRKQLDELLAGNARAPAAEQGPAPDAVPPAEQGAPAPAIGTPSPATAASQLPPLAPATFSRVTRVPPAEQKTPEATEAKPAEAEAPGPAQGAVPSGVPSAEAQRAAAAPPSVPQQAAPPQAEPPSEATPAEAPTAEEEAPRSEEELSLIHI